MSAINERGQIDGGDYLPRDRLIIRVSDDLRSAGSVIVLLEKVLRSRVAELINKLDQFNSEIETVDPGRREEARLNQRLKSDLADAFTIGAEVSRALREILDREP